MVTLNLLPKSHGLGRSNLHLEKLGSPNKEILRNFLLGIAQKGNSLNADLIFPFLDITCLVIVRTLENLDLSISSHVDQLLCLHVKVTLVRSHVSIDMVGMIDNRWSSLLGPIVDEITWIGRTTTAEFPNSENCFSGFVIYGTLRFRSCCLLMEIFNINISIWQIT